MKASPRAVRFIVVMMAIYLLLGPYSRQVIGQIDRRRARLDRVVPADGLPAGVEAVAVAT